jgi:hypothetical protein
MEGEECKLAIVVFACNTVEKYLKELESINKTWGKKCQEYPNIRLLFFLGEERVEGAEFEDTSNTKYIHLPGVGNDYLSASYKQWAGLKYVYEQHKPKFTICIGTDTYLNIPALLSFLEAYNPECPLYIGGHSAKRQIGDKAYRYQAGGPGFVLTIAVLEKLYPYVHLIMDDWIQVCMRYGVTYLIVACDVAMAFYLENLNLKPRFIDAGPAFIHCNYFGNPCCYGNIDMSKIVSCHFMNPHDSQVFTRILEANNYYV